VRKNGPLVDSSPALDSRDHIAWCADGGIGFARLASKVMAEAPDDEQVLIVGPLDPPGWDPAQHFADEIDARRLRLIDVNETYGPLVEGATDCRRQQLQHFENALDDARAEGNVAIRVVADNTTMLTGSDELADRWLDWEQFSDRWQATQPVAGICYFDRTRVSAERLAQTARLHPLDRGFQTPDVRMYHDADAPDGTVSLVLDGSVECFDQTEFRNRLRAEAIAVAESADTDLAVDLSGLEYMHHSALIALNDTASLFADATQRRENVHLHNAPPVVRRLHSLMPDIDRVGVCQ
jgi:hypothetical protein